MATAQSLMPINATVSFDMNPLNTIIKRYNAVKVLSWMGYDVAIKFADVQALHEQYLASNPTLIPDNPRDYNYVLIQRTQTDGAVITEVLGDPWINSQTILGTTVVQYTIVAYADPALVSSTDISNALLSVGLYDMNISVSNQG